MFTRFATGAAKHSVCFPGASLATQGNIKGNNVSATMFPSLARPLDYELEISIAR